MGDRGEWIQILMLLIFGGLYVARWVISRAWGARQENDPAGRRPEKPGRKSPAIEMLERLRAESEQAPAVTKDAPVTGARAVGAAAAVYDDGSDDEDAFFGDDDTAGQHALPDDVVGKRGSRASPRAASPAMEPPQLPGRPSLPAAEPTRGRAAGRSQVPASTEINLSAAHPRSPRDRVVHPRTETARPAVAAPRSADEHVEIYSEMELSDAAADLGMGQLPVATTARPAPTRLRGLLRAQGMTLRQALIGQIILGPPRSRRA